MRLHTSIARYIRRCGYALALTLATGAFMANAQSTAYQFDIDASIPETPGAVSWGTTNMIQALKDGKAVYRGWCPWRGGFSPNNNYEIFIPNASTAQHTNSDIEYSITRISYAYRPDLQNDTDTNDPHINWSGGSYRPLQEISYVGARSLLPAADDCSSVYYHESTFTQGEPIYCKNKNGVMKVTYANPVYNEKGEHITDANGEKLYTTFWGGQAYRKEGNNYVAIEPLSGITIKSDPTGDDVNDIRGQIEHTADPQHVHHNKLIIEYSGFSLAVGAYSQYGNTHDNLTYIHDVRVSDDIIGAISYRGDSYDNTLIVIRAEAVGDNVTKSIEQAGVNAGNYNNSGKIYGANAETVYNNKTLIYGSSVYQGVIGGLADYDAYDNYTLISRSLLGTGTRDHFDVYGADSTYGDASNNTLVLDDTLDPDAFGIPEEDTGSTGGAYGGKTSQVPDASVVHMSIYGASSGSGNADNNTVLLLGNPAPEPSMTVEGDIYGAYISNKRDAERTSASGNFVVLSNVTMKDVCIVQDLVSSEIIDDKEVNVWKDKTIATGVGTIYGSYICAPNDAAIPGNANNNSVFLTDTTIVDNVYGSYNESSRHEEETDEQGNVAMYGDASGNIVELDNVEAIGAPHGNDNEKAITIYGGYSEGGNTNGNDVVLHGFDDAGKYNLANAFIRGGGGDAGSATIGLEEYQKHTQGNRLILDAFQGAVAGIGQFEQVHFAPSAEVDLTKPILTLTADQTLAPSSMTMTTVGGETPILFTVDLTHIADKVGLEPGQVRIIPLVGRDNNQSVDDLHDVKEAYIPKTRSGITRINSYKSEYKVLPEGTPVVVGSQTADGTNWGVLEIMDVTSEVTPESKALVEGRIATLTLNNMGGNLVAEQGIDSACRALEGGTPADANTYVPVAQDAKGSPVYAPKSELKPGNRLFFAMSGAHNKVDSGSDVDVDGTNALVGISRGFLAKRALTLGAFMETGWGKYHTHNHFGLGSDVPSVRGTGETSYVGAGALLRYHLEHLNKKLDGISLDASVRIGRQETDYSTADLVDDYGTFARYDHESDYIAGHVGVNYTFQPTDKLSALVYARYLWTHVSNEEATVCGESVTFEDMHSNRVRLGGRLSWKATEKWTPYVGAAYEWEFSGTARANTHGMGITAPSMRGGSVIGEIGAVWQPNLNRALWIEGALQGSVGKNENYGARIGVSIGF